MIVRSMFAFALVAGAAAAQVPQPQNQPDSALQPQPSAQPTDAAQKAIPAPALPKQGAPAPLAPPPATAPRGPSTVKVASSADGLRLQVDGHDFMVYGMNWDYVPIGQNYAWDLWSQPEPVIIEALEKEMPLLKRMGVNAIRQYVGIPPRWVKYIHEHWGIYTVLNHTVGRYGYNLDGVWLPEVDYSDPHLRAALTSEVTALVDQYRETPGILMWLLGNENNYGLHWASAEVEALPEGKRDEARARKLYSLFGEIIQAVHKHDRSHPVAIANGDLQYLDIIAEECKGLDVFGTNVYRGHTARDLFEVVGKALGIPVMFTEFGADAFDAKRGREDDVTQARYLHTQWQQIYEQTAGKGGAGNAIGGFIFQWSDGWWKFGQQTRLDIHDPNASWPNAGYVEDYVEGQNNMNEEWWGICAKGPPDSRGIFDEYPRSAYYVLRDDFKLDPYAPGTTVEAIRAHFAAVDPAAYAQIYRADTAALSVAELDKVRVSGLRMALETYSTGGTNATLGPRHGFDHLETFFADLQARPTQRVIANLSINVVGNSPLNPIDEIFYERRVQPVPLVQPSPTGTGTTTYSLQGNDRVKVYGASLSWDDDWFNLFAYHRVGHYHWGYEGDFFGLYREANYGPSTDIYNADVPSGMEVSFKRALEGLKVAFGPQIWWGANPQVMLKYERRFGSIDAAVMYSNEIAPQTGTTTSAAIPTKPTQKATLYLARHFGLLGVEVGGIWAGSTRNGDAFDIARADNTTYTDHIVASDDFGGKLKLSLESGRWHWYGQTAYQGLVANGGPTQSLTYTGWSLLDSGSGNQVNALTGVAVNVGLFQIAPNFLWQKPLVGPVPASAGRARNVLQDPFVVRANREELAAEVLITFDPTPGTWLWAWDNDLREDARFAVSLDLSYRHFPTTQDAGIAILGDGSLSPFPGAPPPHDLVEARARIAGSPLPGMRLVGHVWTGNAESTGVDPRLITRFGADARASFMNLAVTAFAKVNDWGPYDYHRDFNLTFPLQLMGDVAYTLGTPRWLGLAQTRVGLRGTLRYLDKYSPRFLPNPADPTQPGREYEIRTYVNVSL